jgi:DNA-binding ferritin-like protein (Dps family)
MNHTYEELERAAYIAGNTALAALYDAAQTMEEIENSLPRQMTVEDFIGDGLETYVDAQVTDQCPDYAEYKQFFDDCFAHLNSHYPCPSVTSGHDCSVIFDAIAKGDTE